MVWPPSPVGQILQPKAIKRTKGAKKRFREFVSGAEKDRDSWDAVERAVWARAGEKAGEFAMVYACSENHVHPTIDEAAAKWGCRLARIA